MSGSNCAGFTLLEMVVAVAVFVIFAAMAYGGLNTVNRQKADTEQYAERLISLQLAVRYLERDIGQVIDRPIRNQFGDEEPAIMKGNESLLKLTQGGWSNPAGLTRSSIQRVGYDIQDDALIRITWSRLDGADEQTALETHLLEGVEEFEVRFLDENEEWQESWPPLTDSEEQAPLPAAVEITLSVDAWGSVRRLFALPR